MLSKPEDKRILTISTAQVDDRVQISLRDNGEGIPSQIKKHLFNHGFTIKPNGHGFGLYNSINYMKEMNGEIIVESVVPAKEPPLHCQSRHQGMPIDRPGWPRFNAAVSLPVTISVRQRMG